ncbi:hypothetical protein BGZ46_007743 [Entomortierella lignicola]|nr:hypothetical protein BGZ46_007743 [Entomortierella lignicola]
MVNTFPDRIEPGPISLLTPWIPFKECPDTTSKTFKFLKHVPRGLVWAVTSSINHLGSVIMSSSNAVTGALTNKDLNDTCVDEQGKDGAPPRDTSTDWMKSLSDPFIVQFSDAFDKIIIPALVQDMNRQHSNGYNSEIQMCVTDVGFDIAEVRMPPGVTVNAYFGYLDTVVPIAAAREMSKKCGWRINEFKHSGHGGPRMSMYALEDYVIGLQEYELSISEEEWFERRIDAQY